jgi:diguanylate cyclase (GGDEF)-like protein/putative nucleotidyltransferase with HDIG domain
MGFPPAEAGNRVRRPVWRISRETARLLPVVLPVGVAAFGVAVFALVEFVSSDPDAATLAGLLALLVASTLAEAFPVPIENVPVGGTSLATVFIVGTAVLYGWPAATLIALLTQLVVESGRRRPLIRIGYNTSVYVLAAAAAGLTTLPFEDDDFLALTAAVLLAATAFYAVNLPLIAAIVARWAREPFFDLLQRAVRSTFVVFAIMASVSLMLAALWERSPFLAAALAGPLLAIALYQRSVHRELEAVRLALTDPLTGLGNHRSFQERLQHDLEAADAGETILSLCLLDIDNFKDINDRHGHPVGDRVLAHIARRLRQNGEAFRLGGDEFALLLPGRGADDAAAVAEAVLRRVATGAGVRGVDATLSAGIAEYPQYEVDRKELLRVADAALYQAKEEGKNQVRIYQPDVQELGQLRNLAEGRDRSARLRAAASLAHAVDGRDAYTGHHSYMVGELAGRIAKRMGLPRDEVELARLAGRLHDIGKLAIPEDILRKPGPLNDAERLVLERHPHIGYRMLESLGIEPVATWVLHHHERWDGRGYPEGLEEEEIPLGSRILFVADAYDAMTSDRVYRGKLSHEDAVAELERCSGAQFDPGIVQVFLEGLEQTELAALKQA